jgi:hypothetical protein
MQNTYGDIDEAENFMDGWFSADLFSDHLRGTGFVDLPSMPSQDAHRPPPTASSVGQGLQRRSVKYDAEEAHLREMHLQHLALASSGSSSALNFGEQSSHSSQQHNDESLDLVNFSSDDDSDYEALDASDSPTAGSKRALSSKEKNFEDDDYSVDESTGAQTKIRAKNREHAKNTRIRKKNYIETLKDHVRQLAEEREKLDRDRRVALTRIAEQTIVRKQVLQTFFRYRATAEMSRAKWATILDESVCIVLPVTPYRSFPPSEVINGQRYVNGIDAVILDTASLGVLVQSIGKNHTQAVKAYYHCGDDDIAASGVSLICRWVMWTENAVACGALFECNKHGMLRATFSPQNRLVKVELVFDVMAFMQQLRRASGRVDFQVIDLSSKFDHKVFLMYV